MELDDRIATHRSVLTPAEIRVSEFMADNPHSVGHLSALKLAEASHTSDATVVRTVRKLGFEGLDELRENLATELSRAGRLDSSIQAITDHRGHSNRGDQTDGPISRHIRDSAAALDSLKDRVGEDALMVAVDTLNRAQRIVTIGFGPSRYLADYVAHRFRRSGVSAAAAGSAGRTFADELSWLTTGDAVILMSYDHPTREVRVLYDRAEQLGIPVIQLSEDIHTVDQRCAAVLGVGRGNPTFIPGYAPTVVVLEALVLAIAASDPERSGKAGQALDHLRERLS
ncbi:MAG TPA: MurR/RpiR family transcriptional regulator [Candidatus Corynebacterium avicola]|uniref:MurR/RpiR family transcriptional regulator n=1 Tax=Candidatus Corynebacterium avicola TaxID=2838527 RepID=A0A9D1UKW4_9CORY|nr:MurR/RpiR family transcriptional regulator [Candidatus Corynebacterium avicola]